MTPTRFFSTHLLIVFLIIVGHITSETVAKGGGGRGGGGGGGGGGRSSSSSTSDDGGDSDGGGGGGSLSWLWICLGIFGGIFLCVYGCKFVSFLRGAKVNYDITTEGVNEVCDKAFERLSRQKNLTEVGTLPPSGRYQGSYKEGYEVKTTFYELIFHPDGKLTGGVQDDDGSFMVEGHFENGNYYWCERSSWAVHGLLKNRDSFVRCVRITRPFHVEVVATNAQSDGSRISGRYFASTEVDGELELKLIERRPNPMELSMKHV